MKKISTLPTAKDLVGIYIELREDLFRFILSKVKSRDDAEDVVQHLYVQLTEMSEEKIINIIDNRSYIFGMANILALNHLSKQCKKDKIITTNDYIEKTDDVEDPARALATQQTMQVLKKAIHDMPAKRRQVFMYYRFRNMSIKEISRDLELSTHAVEKHIVRALLLCREKLQEAGLQ